MSHTLREVSELTGRSEAVLRKHIERDKLVATKEGGRTVVTDEDLDRYLGAEELERTAHAMTVAGDLEPLGSLLTRLPASVQQAILDGIPSGKKAGSPEPFKAAVSRLTE